MSAIYILGISCYYHDSAAALIKDGEILAAVQEERFTRKKHDASFPLNSIKYLLKEFGLELPDVEAIVYYEKPFITFERILETHLEQAPFGLKSFLLSMPVWIKEKLFLEKDIKSKLKTLGQKIPPLKYSEHHLSHAASAFFPSPLKRAAVLCMDGVGEWATSSAWVGDQSELRPLWEIHFPHSLGLFYSTITAYLGFKVNSGEYKVMGLAPYGKPRFCAELERLLELHEDGSFSLNREYFAYESRLKMFSYKLEVLLGRKAREPESLMDQFHMDVAASLQKTLEKAMLHVVTHLHLKTGEENLCLAGGVALNCVANSELIKKSGFKNIWVQPSAGDAGGALGAALAYYHLGLGKERSYLERDGQKGSYLGPEYSEDEIQKFLEKNRIPYKFFSNQQELLETTARYLEDGKIIGWFQGRMEFGPRALGHRSIIGDARIPDLQKTMNLKIKFRESFRPFAPIVLAEDVQEFFEFDRESPYMLFVAPVKEKFRHQENETAKSKFGIERLNEVRSKFPAITHIDYSARLQTVSRDRSPLLHQLLTTFKERNHTSVLVNTSFNVRGEPIVCSPLDAYRCFRRTEIDVLVLGKFIIHKEMDLPPFSDHDWRSEFELD